MSVTPPYLYRLYGISIKSHWALTFPCLEAAETAPAQVELIDGPPVLFSGARAQAVLEITPAGYEYAPLGDGSIYLSWPGLFEFLVSADGLRIAARPGPKVSWESFYTYLFAQVLSFALLKQGIEPLHCTAVVLAGGAVGFLGDCGYGKSSLAAAFLQAGYPLLTDDLLVLKENGRGFLAYPSFPRIKLFPEIAQALLGGGTGGVPYNPHTSKMIIPLGRDQSCRKITPLKAFFVLRPPVAGPPRKKVSIRTLSQRQTFLAVTANTFNARLQEPGRLKRLFALASRIAARLPVKSLSYPRDLARLPEVVEAVRVNLAK